MTRSILAWPASPLVVALVLAASAVPACAAPTVAIETTAATAPAPVDPSRLAIARATVDFVFPAGTYARVMDRTLNSLIQPMMDGFGKIPLRDLAGLGGLSADQVAAIGPGTLREIMEIIDPVFDRRTKAMVAGLYHEMGGMMIDFEPTMRDGLAHAFARRFTTQQLCDMNAFFATPSGKAYAAESMTIYTDPDVTGAMQAFLPRMMKQMPDLIRKVEAATADLPRRRAIKDLSPADRKRLAELLGVDESDLKAHETPKPGGES
jgi:hypothetical protein